VVFILGSASGLLFEYYVGQNSPRTPLTFLNLNERRPIRIAP
jgi:hypothetical protein